jgi:DNA replication and repair protein RecF
MIRFSSDYCFLEGVFERADTKATEKASVGFSRDKKVSMKIDGNAVGAFSQWLGRTTAIAFGPDDIQLVQGQPKERRAFLDLLISQIDATYLESLILYRRNLAQRNALLAAKIDDMQIDAYEQAMAIHGADIFIKRTKIIELMKEHFSILYGEISESRESALLEYKPSIRCDSATPDEWKNVFYSDLKNTRKKDIQNGFSSIGPHRDDVLMFLDGKGAKPFASQGQCTTLTLSLRMSSIFCCEAYNRNSMIFLFDDALTYLDTVRTSRVFPLIKSRGQIFVATASDKDMQLQDIPRITVASGQVMQS